MRSLIIIFTITISSLSAQTIDYNLKKGYAANGYDVVSYFNNKAIEGNRNFTATYDNTKYKFSSENNLNTFKKDPKMYIPQYGGYCAYAVAIKSNKVSINPKTFKINEGKLYLFYNAWGTNTLELWQKQNESELQKKADVNWENIKFKK
ncbi:YHS domain-containing (seleno)protein [uncultured Algibacter sp.]|uniref:YHS domain-containing (seleno)protein n=1 Tax=uncultured Algibacter sp. TaxID=298659 RepID=UPI002620FF23|nr:YHS domain-containing (seleno)protein [uncultured Algibacter sp.]